MPRLRGIGLAQARGEWVAMTEDHCIADPGWLAALVAATGPGAEVLGGRMGNAQRARATDCGAFFSEYGFFGARHDGASGDSPPLITGANVAYHESVVNRVAAWATSGNWENVMHGRLHASGCRFRVVPSALIRQNQTYRLGAFCRDRFEHGRGYAANRARGTSAWGRAILAASTPILPLLLATRVARAVSPEERRHFWRALPATLTFLAAWSAGEAVGYARAGGAA
jgi:GT2 family glycosyltransferase